MRGLAETSEPPVASVALLVFLRSLFFYYFIMAYAGLVVICNVGPSQDPGNHRVIIGLFQATFSGVDLMSFAQSLECVVVPSRHYSKGSNDN